MYKRVWLYIVGFLTFLPAVSANEITTALGDLWLLIGPIFAFDWLRVIGPELAARGALGILFFTLVFIATGKLGTFTKGNSSNTNDKRLRVVLSVVISAIGMAFLPISFLGPVMALFAALVPITLIGVIYWLVNKSPLGESFKNNVPWLKGIIGVALLAVSFAISKNLLDPDVVGYYWQADGVFSQGFIWSLTYILFVVLLLIEIWRTFSGFGGRVGRAVNSTVDYVSNEETQQRWKKNKKAFNDLKGWLNKHKGGNPDSPNPSPNPNNPNNSNGGGSGGVETEEEVEEVMNTTEQAGQQAANDVSDAESARRRTQENANRARRVVEDPKTPQELKQEAQEIYDAFMYEFPPQNQAQVDELTAKWDAAQQKLNSIRDTFARGTQDNATIRQFIVEMYRLYQSYRDISSNAEQASASLNPEAAQRTEEQLANLERKAKELRKNQAKLKNRKSKILRRAYRIDIDERRKTQQLTETCKAILGDIDTIYKTVLNENGGTSSKKLVQSAEDLNTRLKTLQNSLRGLSDLQEAKIHLTKDELEHLQVLSPEQIQGLEQAEQYEANLITSMVQLIQRIRTGVRYVQRISNTDANDKQSLGQKLGQEVRTVKADVNSLIQVAVALARSLNIERQDVTRARRGAKVTVKTDDANYSGTITEK